MRADICIVGAGAAGCALAHALRGSSLDVVLLESGPSGAGASLDAGETVGLPYNGLEAGRVRGLGGTTAVWPGQCMRLRADDLASWPIETGELEPWYDAAERLLGLVPGETRKDPWLLLGERDPGFDRDLLDYATGVFAPRRRLGDLDLDGIRVLTGCTAVRVADGTVDARGSDGQAVTVEAASIVVCAGGLETPRLLLASGFAHDALGRYFQDHAVCRPARVVGRPRAFQDTYGLRLRGGRRYSPKLVLGRAPRAAEELPGCQANIVFDYGDGSPLEAALAVRRALKSRRPPRARDVRRAVRGSGELAAGALRVVRGREPAPRPQAVRVLAIVEQVPRPESRLSLSDDVDVFGVPRLRVDWRLGEAERRSIETFVHTLDAELRRTGAGALDVDPWLADPTGWTDHLFDSFHPAGAARMGPDGVVDTTCRVHDTKGVYVCGSAVFPTSGCANPTLTIVALALRLAEHLQS